MAPNTILAKVEHERLFGENVDIFKNYYAVLGIRNILKKIGLRNSYDSDWAKALINYITITELSEMYDRILPREARENLANSRNFRTPPELTEDDADDVIIYLAKNPVYRKKMWKVLGNIFAQRTEEYKKLLDNSERQKSAVEIRFEEMQNLFSLNDKELHAIVAVFMSQTRALELGDFDIGRYRSGEKISALAQILDIPDIEAATLLDDKNNIKKFGLIDNDLDLDNTFLAYLSCISSKPLAERFWNKYEGEVLPWDFHGKLAEKHGAVLKKMIRAKNDDNGSSILFFGVPGSGKTSFAVSLAADMGKTLYFIAQNDSSSHRMSYSPAFRYAALAVAQKQLDPANSILVIDEADKLLENSSLGGGFLSMLFGNDVSGSRDSEAKGQLNSIIDTNRHTIIWICNSRQESIDPSSRRRFDYSVFFDELSSTARSYIWGNALRFYGCEGKLDDDFISKLSARYPVNPGGISIAVKNAALVCSKDTELDFGKEVLSFLKAHCSLLGIQETPPDLMEPALDYSLEGLNIRSGIKLPRLINACKNFLKNSSEITACRDQPRMNLLIFGAPGAGKTEFVKYLAKQLDKKLLVKNASDILSKFVGGTEERIAAAFAEAEAEKAILFMDEADSLLSARDNAVRSFEVSQVNTLLTEMERFRGIFICSTNLIQRIDTAALRRFSFRLHFDYLTNEGKELFFNTYFTAPLELPKLSSSEKNALFAIEQMTPSDFRNVRQQFFYLEDETLSNMEIIEALETELESRTSGQKYHGLGNVVQRIGF